VNEDQATITAVAIDMPFSEKTKMDKTLRAELDAFGAQLNGF
jgi:hypothetical protein